MKKLLLLLVPLVLLISCETSAEVVEVAVEPPQSGIVVGVIRECAGGQSSGSEIFFYDLYGVEICESEKAAAVEDGRLRLIKDFWKITVLTPQGESYVIELDVVDSAEFLPVEIGDTWPPSE